MPTYGSLAVTVTIKTEIPKAIQVVNRHFLSNLAQIEIGEVLSLLIFFFYLFMLVE